jgi:hypothetical protein
MNELYELFALYGAIVLESDILSVIHESMRLGMNREIVHVFREAKNQKKGAQYGER